MAAAFIALFGVAAELRRGVFQPGIVNYQRLTRQVIKQVAEVFAEKQRQIIFHPGRRNALADIGVDRAGFRVLFKKIEPAGFEGTDSAGVQRKLACRQNADGIDLIQRALGFRIEGAQGFDFIVEQFDAERRGLAHRKNVDDGTAHRKLTMLIHRINTVIAGGFKL